MKFPRSEFFLAATALAFLLLPAALPAYGPKTVTRMTEGALRVAPVSLRSALLAYPQELRTGVEEGLAWGDADPAPAADAAVAAISSLVTRKAPFADIARAFGKLAGLAFLANDPLRGIGKGPLSGLSGDYYAYVEKVLPRLVLTFDGYGGAAGTAGATLTARTIGLDRYRKALEHDYFPGGRRASSASFDDLSNAFGTAQGVLSHAVSDAARVWLTAWEAVNGDTSATPYLKR